MRRLIGIFGLSGFARECADIAEALGHDVVFIAAAGEANPIEMKGRAIVYEENIFDIRDASFIIGIGNGALREKIASKYSGRLTFCNLIHPTASFGNGVLERIEERVGVIVCAGVRMTNNIDVEDFCIFNLNATVGHDCWIGGFVTIAPLASISGNVSLGARVSIGTGANLNNGDPSKKLRVGHDTTIGSGAVVIRDCDPVAVYAGVPARRIK
jgi:sugar O-acyltransferase (sialic acid O-acetyltransferase NeuD family)